MILHTLQCPVYYNLAPSAYSSDIEKPCFHLQICENISGMALAVIIEDLLCAHVLFSHPPNSLSVVILTCECLRSLTSSQPLTFPVAQQPLCSLCMASCSGMTSKALPALDHGKGEGLRLGSWLRGGGPRRSLRQVRARQGGRGWLQFEPSPHVHPHP